MSTLRDLIGLSAALVVATAAGPTALAADGKTLHDENCMHCHDSSPYTRASRRVTTRDALHAQVGRCEQSLGLKWFEDDIVAVVDHLNASYYKFPAAR
ncbi:MAG: cytochrome c [Chromatiales bacterium]|nr:cytochrome c [Chromatiales bacterium]